MQWRSNTRGAVAAVLLAIGALATVGCGREEPADLANGKELFIGEGTCGSCHALARAGTTGTQGPDLDAAFGPSRRAGMGEETVEGIVSRQIAHPLRGSIMQPNLVAGDDARDVAAYIAQAAGMPGEDEGALASIGQAEEAQPVAAEGDTLTLPADPSGALAFVSGVEDNPGRVSQATAEAGQLLLTSLNESPIEHNIAISNGIEELGPVVGTGGTSEVTVDVEPGEYLFLCTVPGHAEGGMQGTLTVE